VPGSINRPGASKSFVTYAGTVLSYDRSIVIIAKTPEHAHAAVRQLSLIGLDRIAGWAPVEVIQRIRNEGGAVSFMRVIEPRALASRLETNDVRVIDVRGRSEWRDGHMPQASHIYLGDLQARFPELRRGDPIVVLCASGTRSSIAASLLMANGFTDVSNLVGGFDAWRKLGLPISQDP
jgi:hydroxyacylglutathione hydrolase